MGVGYPQQHVSKDLCQVSFCHGLRLDLSFHQGMASAWHQHGIGMACCNHLPPAEHWASLSMKEHWPVCKTGGETRLESVRKNEDATLLADHVVQGLPWRTMCEHNSRQLHGTAPHVSKGRALQSSCKASPQYLIPLAASPTFTRNSSPAFWI